jgi:hypothetical protein
MSTTTTTAARQMSRPFNSNTILLLVVSFLSFFFAEQILTGWLPLGDRLNLSRRDFNAVEIAAVVGAIGWGLITLRVAWGFFRHEQMHTIRSYFTESAPMPSGILLTTIFLALVGFLSLLIAEQVLAGWLPLGDRSNISRRDINLFEWLAVILCFELADGIGISATGSPCLDVGTVAAVIERCCRCDAVFVWYF